MKETPPPITPVELSDKEIKLCEDEHAALCAVAEAAERLPRWIAKAIDVQAFSECASPSGAKKDIENFSQALVRLDAVRGGKESK